MRNLSYGWLFKYPHHIIYFHTISSPLHIITTLTSLQKMLRTPWCFATLWDVVQWNCCIKLGFESWKGHLGCASQGCNLIYDMRTPHGEIGEVGYTLVQQNIQWNSWNWLKLTVFVDQPSFLTNKSPKKHPKHPALFLTINHQFHSYYPFIIPSYLL